MARRVFSKEFKLEAVKQVRERGITAAQARRDLGVHEMLMPSNDAPPGLDMRCTSLWAWRNTAVAAGTGRRSARQRRAAARSQAPDAKSGRGERLAVELRLDVDEAAALRDLAREFLLAHVSELAVGDGNHHRVGRRQRLPGHEFHPVLVARCLGIGYRVVYKHLDAIAFQLVGHIDDVRVAQVGNVFLEGQPEHDDLRAFHGIAVADHVLDGLFGNELSHIVVDAPPGEDHLRVVAEHLRLVGEVIGVDADAVASDQAGAEREKVPFGSGRLENLEGIDAYAIEDDRQFVNQCDIQVSLSVLDDLGRFGDLDARDGVHAGLDYGAIEIDDLVERFGCIARDDLYDGLEPVFLVAGVDALGRVADIEIREPDLPGIFFKHRNADFLGRARVDGRFIYHGRTLFHVFADRGARTDQRPEVRPAHGVHRRGHRDHDDVGGGKLRRLGRYGEPGCGTQLVAGDLSRRI